MSYTLEKKQVKAHPIRALGSTLIAKDVEDLIIVYNKFKSSKPRPSPETKLTFNLVFCHGTGFNKSVWTYLIKQLYKLSESGQVPWHLDTVLAIDAVGHGDSSVANDGKLGSVFMWDDGSKDVIEVIKHERKTTGDMQNDLETRTVAVGHSMGGHIVLFTSFLESTIFDAVVAIEPIIYETPETKARYITLLKKLVTLLKDTFDTEQEARDYFSKYSFTKDFQSEVSKNYIDDEVYKTKNEEGKTVFKSKCLAANQISTYMSENMGSLKGMLALPLIKVPIFHIIGGAAVWNLKESAPWFRESVRPDLLAAAINVDKGKHLVNSEQPDDIIKIIADALTKRDKDFKQTRSTIPEVALKGDREALRKHQQKLILTFDMDNVYGYDADKRYVPFDLHTDKYSSKL